jgi:iron complex transport system substrate-binding protein
VTRTALLNMAGLAFTLGIATLSVAREGPEPAVLGAPRPPDGAALDFVTLPDGTRALRDHGGHATPLRPYARILSGSTVTDQLLVELCERDRIVAFTAYGAAHHPNAAFAGVPTHPGLSSIELVTSLKPDLVITNHVGDPKILARLREQGLEVFDLGELRGASTLVPDVLAVGELVGHPEAAASYARRFARRLAHVAPEAFSTKESERPTSLYVTLYGTQLSGGASGTSYHDVIVAAGLRDVATPRYHDWPLYTSEDLLEMDPDTVTTLEGTASRFCRHPGLERLRVCRGKGRILELRSDLIGDPGPRMLEAAEALHDLAYPAGAATSAVSGDSR